MTSKGIYFQISKPFHVTCDTQNNHFKLKSLIKFWSAVDSDQKAASGPHAMPRLCVTVVLSHPVTARARAADVWAPFERDFGMRIHQPPKILGREESLTWATWLGPKRSLCGTSRSHRQNPPSPCWCPQMCECAHCPCHPVKGFRDRLCVIFTFDI